MSSILSEPMTDSQTGEKPVEMEESEEERLRKILKELSSQKSPNSGSRELVDESDIHKSANEMDPKPSSQMVKITIRMVGGENDTLFKRIELDPQIHVDDLVKRIETVTKIPPDFQKIKFRGEELPDSLHPLESINNFEELIVKHSELSRWTAYKKCLDLVLTKTDDKKANARDAVRHHELLMKCGFFDAYLEFDDYRKQKHSKVASWTDGDINLIRDAAEQYFHRLHDLKRGNQESDFICNFEDKDLELGGRSTSTLAFVRIHGEDFVSKFYIKCHHYGPKGTSSDQVPDVTEFYCYKLLELIGVGPKCHIIPPSMSTGTKTSAYIVTQWDDKFELLENVIDENSLCADVVVQLVMLRVLLFISDLHEQNCGRWKGTKHAAIVDFSPTNDFQIYPDIKREMIRTYLHKGWKKEYFAVKNQHDDNSWLKTAKVYFDKWDLSSKIELAREQLDPTKVLLKSLDIGFKKRKLRFSPTDQLNEYIDTLYKNLEHLQTLFNSIV